MCLVNSKGNFKNGKRKGLWKEREMSIPPEGVDYDSLNLSEIVPYPLGDSYQTVCYQNGEEVDMSFCEGKHNNE